MLLEFTAIRFDLSGTSASLVFKSEGKDFMNFDRMIQHLLPLDRRVRRVIYDETLQSLCALAAMPLCEKMNLSKIKEFEQTKDRRFWIEAMPFLVRLGPTRTEAASAVMKADDRPSVPPSERLKRVI